MGLLRPITLWPFRIQAFANLSKKAKLILVFEMSTGQMIDDVRLATQGRIECEFTADRAGVVAAPQEIARIIERHWLQRGSHERCTPVLHSLKQTPSTTARGAGIPSYTGWWRSSSMRWPARQGHLYPACRVRGSHTTTLT